MIFGLFDVKGGLVWYFSEESEFYSSAGILEKFPLPALSLLQGNGCDHISFITSPCVGLEIGAALVYLSTFERCKLNR